MKEDLSQMIAQLEQLTAEVEKRKKEIAAYTHTEFIKAFVKLSKAQRTLQDIQETLQPRASWMVHNEQKTLHKLRKEHFRVL